MTAVGFIGLGAMGSPMARHLATAGHSVTVYNRSTAKAEAWVATNGGALELTPKAVAQASEIVFMCVGNDNDVRAVVLGAGLATRDWRVDEADANALAS